MDTKFLQMGGELVKVFSKLSNFPPPPPGVNINRCSRSNWLESPVEGFAHEEGRLLLDLYKHWFQK